VIGDPRQSENKKTTFSKKGDLLAKNMVNYSFKSEEIICQTYRGDVNRLAKSMLNHSFQ
jgi:hypothetical protein